jgi:hypothetical protein
MSRFNKSIGGLPGKLPEGETILWQARPEWRALARHAFRIRMVAVYFGLLIIWRVVGSLDSGHTAAYAATSAVSCVTLAAAGIGLFCLFAWLISRTTTYTITTRRAVITYGMALPKSINLPFTRIDAADLRINADGTGDIALKLPAKTRLSYLLLWPHVRAGVKGRAEPVLRCVADPQAAADVLADALAATLAAGERTMTAQPQPAELHVMTAQAA